MSAATMILETERLRLTTWLASQREDIYHLHSDPLVCRYLTKDGSPEDETLARYRLNTWQKDFARLGLCKFRVTAKHGSRFLGRAGFGRYRETGEFEMGYALLRNEWGKGYAKEAAIGLRDWFFRRKTDDHFIAFADVRNAPSLGVLRAIGMSPTKIEIDPDGVESQFFTLDREGWRG